MTAAPLPPRPDSPLEASGERAVLDRLFAVAQAYRNDGSVRQAMDLYWELVEDFPETRQANDARKVLLELASQYEREGARHAARTIYERLL